MAWIFSLSAECGIQEAAEKFLHHFDKVAWVLSDGRQSQSRPSIFQDSEDIWWCLVTPSGISETGINTPQTAYLMTELGILLYQRLQSAPTFRYALVGLEVDEFRTYSELIEDDSALSFPGLVLAESIWQAIGSPSGFRGFSEGYVWKPYEGEVYKLLTASLDLRNKMNELLLV